MTNVVQTIASAEDVGAFVNIAKDIGSQSDRVLSIVFMAVSLLVMGLMLYVFIRREDRKDELLVNLTKEANQSHTELAVSLSDLKEAVRENSDVMKSVKLKFHLGVVGFLGLMSLTT